MRICKIYDDDYPWDVRVEKIGRSLARAGHEVTLATRNRQRRQEHEHVDGMDVCRMPAIGLLPAALDEQLMFPAFFSPRWLAHIHQVASRSRSEAILVRDLPLAPAAAGLGRRLGIPVLLDMAENYPAFLRAVHGHTKPTLANRIVRNAALAQVAEDLVLPLLEHVFVVCEENRERLIEKGLNPARVTVVANTPDLESFVVDNEVLQEAKQRFDGSFVLSYTGDVDPFRGLDTVVEALSLVRGDIPNVKLAVVGKGQGRSLLEAQARELGVQECIDFLGFRPLAQLPGLISGADISVIPHHRSEHYDTTLPNKLFDAMALATPVLASDAVPMERIIRSTGCGRAYRSGNPASLAREILRLRDGSLREACGEAGQRAARGRYNWARDSGVLLSVLESLQERR